MYHGADHANYYELVVAMSDPIPVILTNVTGNSIGGFEFILTWDPAVLIMVNEGLYPGDLNFGNGNSGEYYVGMTMPRPISAGNATLCEPVFFGFTYDTVYVYVTHWGDAATLPGAIAYVEFDNVGHVHQMFPASGGFDVPLFAFNLVVGSSESRTWSELKSLYR